MVEPILNKIFWITSPFCFTNLIICFPKFFGMFLVSLKRVTFLECFFWRDKFSLCNISCREFLSSRQLISVEAIIKPPKLDSEFSMPSKDKNFEMSSKFEWHSCYWYAESKFKELEFKQHSLVVWFSSPTLRTVEDSSERLIFPLRIGIDIFILLQEYHEAIVIW